MDNNKLALTNNTNPPHLPPYAAAVTAAGATSVPAVKIEESPLKQHGGGPTNGGDRLKRDEWSEGAVSTLLDAYESKWILRNRAKLKGQDWEDIARFVSTRSDTTKSPKTQTQCKNKIESMKKRYRSESSADAASSSTSSWPLFPRLDLLLRGTGSVAANASGSDAGAGAVYSRVAASASGSDAGVGAVYSPKRVPTPPPPLPLPPALPLQTLPPALMPTTTTTTSPLILFELPLSLPPPQPPVIAQPWFNGTEIKAIREDAMETKVSEDQGTSNKNCVKTDSDSSTPAAQYSDGEKSNPRKMKTKMEKKRKRRSSTEDHNDIAESIRWLAKVMVKSEQARMDTMKEVEKMRAEAEVKRGEMDLKRTQIIANTQLEIAKIFAGCSGKNIDSSLPIRRN